MTFGYEFFTYKMHDVIVMSSFRWELEKVWRNRRNSLRNIFRSKKKKPLYLTYFIWRFFVVFFLFFVFSCNNFHSEKKNLQFLTRLFFFLCIGCVLVHFSLTRVCLKIERVTRFIIFSLYIHRERYFLNSKSDGFRLQHDRTCDI